MASDLEMYRDRQQALRGALRRGALDGALISHLPNIRYLCGFTGSAGVLMLTADQSAFFTDGRYLEQAKKQVAVDQVQAEGNPLRKGMAWAAKAVRGVLGCEESHLTVKEWQLIKGDAKNRLRLRDASDLVEKLRMIKDIGEIDKIRAAVELGSRLFQDALEHIRPGVRETEIAAEIEYQARRAGAQGMSFETIVASGARSALPHGVATPQPLPATGFVVLDFGVILSGYCSDMTRTVHLGKPDQRARKMYLAVFRAQRAALKAVKAGARADKVDQAARSLLQQAGLGQFFTHSTGHGVGLEIHERPRLAQKCSDKLKPGMVITIEPGVYVPGAGGVRIEDMVVVTPAGCEVLTPTPKELIVV